MAGNSPRGVSLARELHVATLTIETSDPGNRIDEGVAAGLRTALESVGLDDDVRVVVVTGSGDAFCLGTDAGALASGSAMGVRCADAIASIQKPVVAALNGDSLDQGLELALACDVRVASSRARLGLTQVTRGHIPWDGGTQRLPRLIGRGRATEMVLSGRLVEASEALEMGLVNRVVAPDGVLQEAQEVAASIAEYGPIAAAYTKEAVLDGQDLTLDQGLRLEADLSFILQTTGDRAEGLRSFKERRKPRYRGW